MLVYPLFETRNFENSSEPFLYNFGNLILTDAGCHGGMERLLVFYNKHLDRDGADKLGYVDFTINHLIKRVSGVEFIRIRVAIDCP